MGELRELLEGHGYEDVRTHLQSGNVLLRARSRRGSSSRRSSSSWRRDSAWRCGCSCGLARAREGRRVDPLGKVATNRLATSSASSANGCRRRSCASSRRRRSPPRSSFDGRELTRGIRTASSAPLAKLLDDEKLGVLSTARNWNTVTKLLELLGD